MKDYTNVFYYLVIPEEGAKNSGLYFNCLEGMPYIAIPVSLDDNGCVENLAEVITLKESIPEGFVVTDTLYSYGGLVRNISASAVYNKNSTALNNNPSAVSFKALMNVKGVKEYGYVTVPKLSNRVKQIIALFHSRLSMTFACDNDFYRLHFSVKSVI